MPIETGSFVNDLTPSNPLGSDPAGQGDDHIRLIKTCVQGTFPNMGIVLGAVVQQDTAVSISSTWNTRHFLVTNSATTTVVLTLPPSASVTSGFYVDFTTTVSANISLVPSGAATVNAAAAVSVPEQSSGRVYFAGGTVWYADIHPRGSALNLFPGNVGVGGTLSVSGTTVLAALSVNGIASFSAAVNMKSTLSVSGAATMGTTLTVGGATTIGGAATLLAPATFKDVASFSAQVTMGAALNLLSGQIIFPAAQNPSAGANTLDDYEEGTFTPGLTFSTIGNLSLTYNTRLGMYTKVGNVVHVVFNVITNVITHTTASGSALIAGMPFTAPAAATSVGPPGALVMANVGISAGYSFTVTRMVESSTDAELLQSGTGVGALNCTVLNFPTGGTYRVHSAFSYRL